MLKTTSFAGADIGKDHDLVKMTFRLRLKKTKMSIQSRLRVDLESLRNPDVAGTFQATRGGRIAQLINLINDNIDIDSMIQYSSD